MGCMLLQRAQRRIVASTSDPSDVPETCRGRGRNSFSCADFVHLDDLVRQLPEAMNVEN